MQAQRREGANSYTGAWIRLTAERWDHIKTSHPEVEDMKEEVLACVANPEKVFAGRSGESLAVRGVGANRYIVVVYRETSPEDGFVITAFLTTRPDRLERRVLLWP